MIQIMKYDELTEKATLNGSTALFPCPKTVLDSQATTMMTTTLSTTTVILTAEARSKATLAEKSARSDEMS